MVFVFYVSVGPLADPQALQSEFMSQHAVVEKLCSDYTAKLRTVGVSIYTGTYFSNSFIPQVVF